MLWSSLRLYISFYEKDKSALGWDSVQHCRLSSVFELIWVHVTSLRGYVGFCFVVFCLQQYLKELSYIKERLCSAWTTVYLVILDLWCTDTPIGRVRHVYRIRKLLRHSRTCIQQDTCFCLTFIYLLNYQLSMDLL